MCESEYTIKEVGVMTERFHLKVLCVFQVYMLHLIVPTRRVCVYTWCIQVISFLVLLPVKGIEEKYVSMFVCKLSVSVNKFV